MDTRALAEPMAEEFVPSVPLNRDDDEWLAAARRIIAAIEAEAT
jgi:hypothetical protein